MAFGIAFTVGALSVAAIVMTPFAAWFGVKVAADLDVRFWTTRYLVMLVYLLMNAATAVFPHTFNLMVSCSPS